MRTILIALLALTFTGSVMAQSKNEKVTFYVNLHCENCVKKVEKHIPHEKGVTNLKINLKGKSVVITYNPKQNTPEKLRKAIEKLGFVVKDTYDEIQKL
jgi:copper chaperone CopZ